MERPTVRHSHILASGGDQRHPAHTDRLTPQILLRAGTDGDLDRLEQRRRARGRVEDALRDAVKGDLRACLRRLAGEDHADFGVVALAADVEGAGGNGQDGEEGWDGELHDEEVGEALAERERGRADDEEAQDDAEQPQR